MSDKNKQPEILVAARRTAQEFGRAVRKLGLDDRLVFLGAVACLVLWFFNWWSMSSLFAVLSMSGMREKYIVGWVACLGIVLLGLANMRFVRVEGATKLAKNPIVSLGLAILAFVFGPFLFLLESPEPPTMIGMREMYEGGKTFWFWLAFAGALATLAGAGLKFMQSRRSAA